MSPPPQGAGPKAGPSITARPTALTEANRTTRHRQPTRRPSYLRAPTGAYLAGRERVLGQHRQLAIDAPAAALELVDELGERDAKAWLDAVRAGVGL